MLKWDTAWRALRDEAGLHGLRFHDIRHTVITELAEMGVADHVLESISGHLSRRMLEHYSHIRIDAKRQALDALDDVRRAESNGDGKPANDAEIETVVEVPDDLTSQSRHSLVLQGSPPSGKLLIPLKRRDVRVVEGARLENDSGDLYQSTPKHFFAQSIQRLPAAECLLMRARKRRCLSVLSRRPYTVSTQF